jgi:hypothetical protein
MPLITDALHFEHVTLEEFCEGMVYDRSKPSFFRAFVLMAAREITRRYTSGMTRTS